MNATLTVFLPARDAAIPLADVVLPELAFACFDRRGTCVQRGRAPLALLPKALATVLVIAARDVLLLPVALPPQLGASRLAQALPNLVEDQLVSDAQDCHIALDPEPLPPPESAVVSTGAARTPVPNRVVAVIDRGWFRFFYEAFLEAGHRALRAVPATRCLGAALAREPALSSPADIDASGGASSSSPVACRVLFCPVAPQAGHSGASSVELVVSQGALGQGLLLEPASIVPALRLLAGGARIDSFCLVGLPADDSPFPAEHGATPRGGSHWPAAIEPQELGFDELARAAIACRFDLCQFQFGAQSWRAHRDSLRRMRVPIALCVASGLIATLGLNLDWWRASREASGLDSAMSALLLESFPATGAVLDAPAQMRRQTDALRTAAGELAPGDFLALGDALGRVLRAQGGLEIRSLDYERNTLNVTFRTPPAEASFRARLAREGLSGTLDGQRWTLRSAQ